jgi:carboxypeptidase D
MTGCSSFDGALMEVGPLRMVLGDKDGAKGKLREAEGAWNEYTNILFSEFAARHHSPSYAG